MTAANLFGSVLHDDDGPDGPALLISDLHVPADGGAVVTALAAALATAAARGARLFVLGDLFDSYASRAQVRIGIWRDIAARFAAAGKAGTRIDVLLGNRDFLLGAEFANASGVRLVDGGLRVRLGGRSTLLVHGDELCRNDLPYQRAKRWLRHPATRWTARRLPLALALRAAERARRRSQRVIAAGDPGRFLPPVSALRAAFATGVEQLVFGHIHRFAHGLCGGGEYWVLPAFDALPVGLLATADGLEPIQFGAPGALSMVVGPPPPCPFPEA